jgi:hypothetical protein
MIPKITLRSGGATSIARPSPERSVRLKKRWRGSTSAIQDLRKKLVWIEKVDDDEEEE